MPPRAVPALNSLEWKLPLLIGAVVALVLLTAFGVTQYEVRQSAKEAAAQRLARVADRLDARIDAALRQRERFVAAVAELPSVQAAFASTATPADLQLAAADLNRLRPRADSALPIQLRALDGRVLVTTLAPEIFSAGTGPVDTPPPALAPLHESTTGYGPFLFAGGEGLYWVATPVRAGDALLGHLLQLRRVANRAFAEYLEEVSGDGLDLMFASAAGGPWAGLDGTRMDGVPLPADSAAFTYVRPDGSRRFAIARSMSTGGWVMIAELPLAAVVAPAQAVTHRVLLFGALLLLLGGLLAWLVSRSVTAPLRRLGLAADAIAAGDYARRTGLDRADEIGLLARSFDAMAGHVDATHAQLEQRFQEARTLAAELRGANARLQQAVEEIDAARGEAQQASRAKSEFLATISHEIRTPINAVIGYTDLMELGIAGSLTEQQQDYVQRIRRSGEHLTTLVNDVLDFAKIESGQMRVAREVTSVAAVVNGAVSMLQGRASARNIRIALECPIESVFLGDAQRTKQVILNLLSNALKFTPAGGRVAIACDRRKSRSVDAHEAADQHEWTCVTVRDSGPGIEQDQLEQIFEPFVQGQAGYTRPHGGAGLGLAISRSLARMMGGDLCVESEPGSGASFTVWLPHPSSALVHAAAVAAASELEIPAGNPRPSSL